MANPHRNASGTESAGTPIPNPADKSDPQTNDQARRDGGKPDEDKSVTKEQIEKIEEKALDHTKDEPGS